MATLRIEWKAGSSPAAMARKVRTYKERLRGAIVDLANVFAARFEDHAKETARWTDRTGNARQGLTATVIENGDEILIILYHTMSYGIWLELKEDYQVIMPTIDTLSPSLMAAVRKLVK